MNVGCWSCRAVHRVDPALLPALGVTARCSACGAALTLSGSRGQQPADDDWFAEEGRSQRVHAPAYPDANGGWSASQDDWFAEERGTRGWGSDWQRALEESDAEAAPEFEGGDRAMGTRAVADRPPVTPWIESSTTLASTPATTQHPFLRVTPHERAQRLARALVSDLIAYHPGRREAAQASGTLRIAFREEIARSYAVYTAEVGRGIAEGTSYFQEALNEMVAQGRALF